MQQREQRMQQKLAEAREAQAHSMNRFIQARARVMQIETRLKTLRTHLKNATTTPDELSPDPARSLDANTSPEKDLPAGQSSNEQATPILIPEQLLCDTPLPDAQNEDRDEEDTKKMAALPAKRSPTAEEALPMALSTHAETTQSTQDNMTEQQETSATDITAKIPVIQRKGRKPQEPV